MNKKVLYIGGGFDILHANHREFINLGIRIFKEKYGDLQEVIIGLKPDSILNEKKGIFRPFFSYEWRKEDVSNFLTQKNIINSVIKTTEFITHLKGRNDVVAQVKSDYRTGGKLLEDLGIEVLYVDPFNLINTSTFETRLFENSAKSNCNLRKVGALLVRQGEIIKEGYSGAGNCTCCSKYLAYQNGKGKLSKNVDCDYPHAEEVILFHAQSGDDVLITDSPCQKCAELIAMKGIRRVTFIKEYHNIEPTEYLIKHGIKVRKAGCI